MLAKYGVPEGLAKDPRVLAFFADRRVQMGELGMSRAAEAAREAKGSPEKFLKLIHYMDRAHTEGEFRSTLAEGSASLAGLHKRHDERLRLSLRVNPAAEVPGVEPSKIGVEAGVTTARIGTANQDEQLMFQAPLIAAHAREFEKGQFMEQIEELAHTKYANDPAMRTELLAAARQKMTEMAARQADLKMADRAKREADQAQTDEALSDYIKAIHGNRMVKDKEGKPVLLTARMIAEDERLSAEDRHKVIGWLDKEAEGGSSGEEKRKHAENLRELTGKILDPQNPIGRESDIHQWYLDRRIGHAEWKQAVETFEKARTPEGEVLYKIKNNFLKEIDRYAKANAVDLDPRAVFAYDRYIDKKVAEARERGGVAAAEKLFDRDDPSYVGSDRILGKYFGSLISHITTVAAEQKAKYGEEDVPRETPPAAAPASAPAAQEPTGVWEVDAQRMMQILAGLPVTKLFSSAPAAAPSSPPPAKEEQHPKKQLPPEPGTPPSAPMEPIPAPPPPTPVFEGQ